MLWGEKCMSSNIYVDLFSVYRDNMNLAGAQILINEAALDLYCTSNAEYLDYSLILERHFESRADIIHSAYAFFVRRTASSQELNAWLSASENLSNREIINRISDSFLQSIEFRITGRCLTNALDMYPQKPYRRLLNEILRKTFCLAKKYIPQSAKNVLKKIYFSVREKIILYKQS